MPSYSYGFKIVRQKYFKTCFNKVFYNFKIEYFFTEKKNPTQTPKHLPENSVS